LMSPSDVCSVTDCTQSTASTPLNKQQKRLHARAHHATPSSACNRTRASGCLAGSPPCRPRRES
jgi:hypothetical protein